MMNTQRIIGASLLIAGLALTGCASTPPPTAEMAISKSAVDGAVGARPGYPGQRHGRGRVRTVAVG